MEKLEELNAQCMRCMEEARRNFIPIDLTDCARFCETGRKIHKLEVESGSAWNKVDWNSSMMKQYYHG